eukprot:scaffold417_cov252-Pinguiococcus_pyrenoidosus.AAC.16
MMPVKQSYNIKKRLLSNGSDSGFRLIRLAPASVLDLPTSVFANDVWPLDTAQNEAEVRRVARLHWR